MTCGLLIAKGVDEEAQLIVLLRTSNNKEDVRALLPSLEITLAAHATDAVPQGSGNAASASGKHDMKSKKISASEFAGVISTEDCTYVIWKAILHLSHPRARLQRPAVYFTAGLTISAEALSATRKGQGDYLQSFEPLPANVLEPLHFDPSLSGSGIYLTETSITKISPATARKQDEVKPVRGASKRAFPILPALFTRIRYSALPDSVVASLHLETSQVIAGDVLIKNVSLDLPSIQVEKLTSIECPKETHAGDEIVLLYRLPPPSGGIATDPAKISVQINASALLDQDSQTELNIRWQAPVDLSQTTIKPTYKWSRPLSASSQQQTSRQSLQAPSRPTSMEAAQKSLTADTGITFNFTAAPTTTQYEEFKLCVQCINRSTRARRFALVVLQPKRTRPKSQETSNAEDTNLIANIFNAPLLEQPKAPDVLDLNPDVRIGPLPPGATYETQMKFRAVTTGVLDLGVIRIVDVDTRQTVDVRELPDVISFEIRAEG